MYIYLYLITQIADVHFTRRALNIFLLNYNYINIFTNELPTSLIYISNWKV